MDVRFITALGTPLDEEDGLLLEGLDAHLADQARAGIDSLLVGGTMGLMPLLPDQTWRDLVLQAVGRSRGRFELLIGAADVSTARVFDRILFTNTIKGIAGVVVMAPGLIRFTGDELFDFYTDIAKRSCAPVYVYDLEPLTGARLSIDLICRLAEHPNIAGIKLSANVPKAASLRLRLGSDPFRLIIAEAALTDMMVRSGYPEHLDGIYAMCPHWATALAAAAHGDDWESASDYQGLLIAIKELCSSELPLWGVFTEIMNQRGIQGKFAPRPIRMLNLAQREQLLNEPIVKHLLRV